MFQPRPDIYSSFTLSGSDYSCISSSAGPTPRGRCSCIGFYSRVVHRCADLHSIVIPHLSWPQIVWHYLCMSHMLLFSLIFLFYFFALVLQFTAQVLCINISPTLSLPCNCIFV